MPQFQVADLIIRIKCEEAAILDSFSDYAISSEGDHDIDLSMIKLDYIEMPEGKHITDGEMIKWLWKPERENGYYLYGREMMKHRLVALLDVVAGWDLGRLLYLNNDLKNPVHSYSYLTNFFIHNFTGIMFRYNLLRHEGIVVHASSIKWNGKGIIFSAPSGTGKSTHVRLWQDRFGSEVVVINDDTPALRFRDEEIFVFGTPWSGQGSNSNVSAPLKAIVLLEQAPLNRIRKLSLGESLSYFMPRCFLPYFDEDFMKLAMAIIERIIISVPIYLMQCRPDQEAVEMVYQWVK